MGAIRADYGGIEPIEAPQESLSRDGQGASGGGDQSVEHAPAEGAVVQQVEELKDSVIDLVLSARQRDEIWGEVSPDARKSHEERCLRDASRLEELVAAFGGAGSVRHHITTEHLGHARQWAKCHLEPWARQQHEE